LVSNALTLPTFGYYEDADSDGYLSIYDCDDTDPALNPDTLWYVDADGDSISSGSTLTQCADPGADWYLSGDLDANTGDCDDTDPGVYPGNIEICDAIDNDCDGLIDDDDSYVT